MAETVKHTRLTAPQIEMLKHFYWGGSVSNPATAWPPIRRLIKRQLLQKTEARNGRVYYKLSQSGAALLASIKAGIWS